MQVISGKYKGLSLLSREGEETRPTLGRVKEAVFSAIQFELKGKFFLDLFSGSGQIGLEAVSRGAAAALLCDADKAACNIIRKNAEKFSAENITILNDDYKNCIKSLKDSEKCDIVYIDPPFMKKLQTKAVSDLVKSGTLADGALIITESQNNDESLCGIEDISGVSLRKKYTYSKIQITVFVYNKK